MEGGGGVGGCYVEKSAYVELHTLLKMLFERQWANIHTLSQILIQYIITVQFIL